MVEASVRDRIREYIGDRFMIGRPPGFLKDSDPFLDKGILDSTGVLELVGYLEEEYGISVEDEEIVPENLGSVDNVVRYILEKTAVST